jgi:hypothetical protein
VGLGSGGGLGSVSAGPSGWQAKRDSRSRLMQRVLICFTVGFLIKEVKCRIMQDIIRTVRDLVLFPNIFYTDCSL